jgi:hypothetical protein
MYVAEFKNNEDVAEAYTRYDEDQKAVILKLLNESKVYLAWYGYGSYSGSSWVIYEHKGKLYEVNGGHCSCYGLEGQWDPEETDWRAIAMRDYNDYEYDDHHTVNEYVKELCKKMLDSNG